jgi:CrcB protein
VKGDLLVFVGVGVCGGLGAVLRYHLARLVHHRRAGSFPLGTLLVNVTGCFVLGVVSQLAGKGALAPEAATVLGAGLCGGYTTYSTLNYETLKLLEDRAWYLAAANLAATALSCAGASMAGMLIGGAA